jgi:hypothetical protein
VRAKPAALGLLQRVASKEAVSKVRPVAQRPAEMTYIMDSSALMAPSLRSVTDGGVSPFGPPCRGRSTVDRRSSLGNSGAMARRPLAAFSVLTGA